MKKLLFLLIAVCLMLPGCKADNEKPTPSVPILVEPEEKPSPSPEPVLQTIGTVYDVDSSLNIRSGPGIEYDVIGKAKAGDRFLVLTLLYSAEWHQIEFNGGLAYVHANYLFLTEEPVP